MAYEGLYYEFELLDELIQDTGKEIWGERFKARPLYKKGIGFRCDFSVNGKDSILNFYKKADRTISIQSQGADVELSNELAKRIADSIPYKDNGKEAYYSAKADKDTLKLLIEFLKSVGASFDPPVQNKISIKHTSYSKIDDKLTLTFYPSTGTIALSGRPLFLYTEATTFLASDKTIKLEDIIQSHIEHYDIDINTSDIRNEIAELMPNAYRGLPVEIIKIMSPSFVMKRIRINMEDYSCYLFSILRGLEGYIKHLFSLCHITIDDNENFGKVFNGHVLYPRIKSIINNAIREAIFEQIYGYLKGTRNTYFHVTQNLIACSKIEDLEVAIEMISEITYLIEETYTKFKSS